MAVPIEGYTVVVKKELMQPLLDQQALEIPNSRAIADNELWICSFMAEEDAEQLLRALETLQLNVSQGPDSDAVLVSEFDQAVTPYCEWLVTAPWEKAIIAWKAGSQPKSVFAREGWDPKVGSGLTRYDPAADELEFVRFDGKVEVFRNKRTGQELFVGRTEASNEALFKTASGILSKQWVTAGEPPLEDAARAEAATAVEMLQTLAARLPDVWRVWWLLGKGELALGNLETAYQAFRRANEIEQETEAIPRELAGVCLELGRFAEAVQLTERAVAIDPHNAGLLSNLALSYLLAGRMAEANKTIAVALTKDPEDSINLTVQRLIGEVASGKRPAPRSMAELRGC